MFFGRSRWQTKRTSGLSMPMPKAIVATMTMPSSRDEAVLVALAHVGLEAGVVRQRGDAFVVQPGRGLVDLLPRLAVDDAGLALVLVAQEGEQLRLGVVLLDDGVADVRPVEAADEDARAAELEALDDVGARQRVGGRGEGDPRHVGEALVQQRELEVVLAEVVAPLADAVRLVDREHREQPALVQRLELGQHARRGDALGRGVEEDQAAAHHLALDPRGRLAVERRVEEGGVDAGLLERARPGPASARSAG